MNNPLVERAALAVKAEIGRQFEATPAPGPDPRDDWTANGGTIDLVDVVRVVLEAIREPTEAQFNGLTGGARQLADCYWRHMIDELLKR